MSSSKSGKEQLGSYILNSSVGGLAITSLLFFETRKFGPYGTLRFPSVFMEPNVLISGIPLPDGFIVKHAVRRRRWRHAAFPIGYLVGLPGVMPIADLMPPCKKIAAVRYLQGAGERLGDTNNCRSMSEPLCARRN
jgi:hypothetical protein